MKKLNVSQTSFETKITPLMIVILIMGFVMGYIINFIPPLWAESNSYLMLGIMMTYYPVYFLYVLINLIYQGIAQINIFKILLAVGHLYLVMILPSDYVNYDLWEDTDNITTTSAVIIEANHSNKGYGLYYIYQINDYIYSHYLDYSAIYPESKYQIAIQVNILRDYPHISRWDNIE